ncbi:MAG: AraC family ligand binding domain-containing protein [Eubacteriales bacterium]|nr:AraC family ligand binding domain-containing protein [Eubacteriales bacterium]
MIELNYTVKGVCNHKVDNKEYMSKKGDLLFINYNQKHYFTANDIEYINILIKPDFISERL